MLRVSEISAADVERIIVGLAQRGERAPVATFGAYGDAAGKAAQGIAHAEGRAFASAER